VDTSIISSVVKFILRYFFLLSFCILEDMRNTALTNVISNEELDKLVNDLVTKIRDCSSSKLRKVTALSHSYELEMLDNLFTSLNITSSFAALNMEGNVKQRSATFIRELNRCITGLNCPCLHRNYQRTAEVLSTIVNHTRKELGQHETVAGIITFTYGITGVNIRFEPNRHSL
jgi:hypothetical protein